MSAHSELAERHRRVLSAWLARYYDEPIELVSSSCLTSHERERRGGRSGRPELL